MESHAAAAGAPAKKSKGTVREKVRLAIVALANPKGSSRAAIQKYLAEQLACDNATAIKAALKAGVASGELVQVGQSFKVPGQEFAAPQEEQLLSEVLREGAGAPAESGSAVTVAYELRLVPGGAGKPLEAAKRFTFELGSGEVIKGWDQGVLGMKKGEQRRLTVPSRLGYGKRGSPPDIPGGATLFFDITLL